MGWWVGSLLHVLLVWFPPYGVGGVVVAWLVCVGWQGCGGGGWVEGMHCFV